MFYGGGRETPWRLKSERRIDFLVTHFNSIPFFAFFLSYSLTPTFFLSRTCFTPTSRYSSILLSSLSRSHTHRHTHMWAHTYRHSFFLFSFSTRLKLVSHCLTNKQSFFFFISLSHSRFVLFFFWRGGVIFYQNSQVHFYFSLSCFLTQLLNLAFSFFSTNCMNPTHHVRHPLTQFDIFIFSTVDSGQFSNPW